MSQKRSHILLGAFVITAFLLVGEWITPLGARSAFREGLRMETCFDESLCGLEKGAPVKLRGVTIGEVTKVTMLMSEYPSVQKDYALVRALIYPELLGISSQANVRTMTEGLVKQGLRVRLTPDAFFQTAYLETVYVDVKKEAEAGGLVDVHWQPRDLYVPATRTNLWESWRQLGKVLDMPEHTRKQESRK